MDLDELKQAWRDLEGSGFESRGARPLRSSMRRRELALLLQLAAGGAALYWIGSFLAEQLAVPKLALPAAMLALAAAAWVGARASQLLASRRVDLGGEVLAVQRQLALLRAARARTAQWTLLLLPLSWTPLAIVAAAAFLEMDLQQDLGGGFVVLNLSLGLAVIPLAIAGARASAPGLEHAPGWKRLADCLACNSYL